MNNEAFMPDNVTKQKREIRKYVRPDRDMKEGHAFPGRERTVRPDKSRSGSCCEAPVTKVTFYRHFTSGMMGP